MELTRTKEEAWEACQALWIELSISGSGGKESTLAYEKYRISRDINRCPLCTYTKEMSGGRLHNEEGYLRHKTCKEFCLKEWPGGSCVGQSFFGLYKLWVHGDTVTDRRKYAKQIYDLPMKNLESKNDN